MRGCPRSAQGGVDSMAEQLRHYDLVIIGTGSAASAAAFRCRAAGWRVAIIDSRPFGGTCALRGCDPKKVLVGAAEVMDWMWRMTGNGIRTDQARIDGRNSCASSGPSLIRYRKIVSTSTPRQAL